MSSGVKRCTHRNNVTIDVDAALGEELLEIAV
jgi:hypothetical protein